MPIFKQQITVTVLLEADNEDEVSALLDCSLATLAYEIDEGDWIGTSMGGPIAEIAPDKVREELLAVGNDGEFFNLC